jgi:hypothetical protein
VSQCKRHESRAASFDAKLLPDSSASSCLSRGSDFRFSGPAFWHEP